VIVAPQQPHEIHGPAALREYLASWLAVRAAKGHA